MKIRTGFVSNSSSSSFVILADKALFDQSVCPNCNHRSEPHYFLSDKFLEHVDNCVEFFGFEACLKSLSDEIAHLEKQLDYKCENWIYDEIEIFQTFKEKIEKLSQNSDKTIIGIDISYSDEYGSSLLESLLKYGVVELLRAEGKFEEYIKEKT